MQKIIAAVALFAASGMAVQAQTHSDPSPRGDVAVTYDWIHTNAQPGDCGCFSLNGAGISGSWVVRPHLGVVADISGTTSRDGEQAGSSLTLTSYMAGVRYYPTWAPRHRMEPFGEVMVGGAHAGGSAAGVADGTSAFAARVGAGLDVPVSKMFVLRVPEIDYLPTTFSNTTNGRQNNLVVSGGVAFRWLKSR